MKWNEQCSDGAKEKHHRKFRPTAVGRSDVVSDVVEDDVDDDVDGDSEDRVRDVTQDSNDADLRTCSCY